MTGHLEAKRAHPRLWAVVVAVLGLCEKDGMPGKRQDLDDEETVALYVRDCAESGLSPEMVWSARDDVRHARYFPRPGELAALVWEHVRSKWRTVTTVVETLPNGVDVVGNRYVAPDSPEWRRHAEALRAAQEQERKALPSDLPDELRARVDALLADPPVRRVPRAEGRRARPAEGEGGDPQAVERRAAMVEELRNSEAQG